MKHVELRHAIKLSHVFLLANAVIAQFDVLKCHYFLLLLIQTMKLTFVNCVMKFGFFHEFLAVLEGDNARGTHWRMQMS